MIHCTALTLVARVAANCLWVIRGRALLNINTYVTYRSGEQLTQSAQVSLKLILISFSLTISLNDNHFPLIYTIAALSRQWQMYHMTKQIELHTIDRNHNRRESRREGVFNILPWLKQLIARKAAGNSIDNCMAGDKTQLAGITSREFLM